MKLTIGISSDRDKLSIDTNQTFSYYIHEIERYSFNFALKAYRGRKLVAISKGVFFDENEILNDSQDITIISDGYDADTESAISHLVCSQLYKRESVDDFAFLSPYSCYINRLYVYPEYREAGVGSYLFNNLYSIFLHCLNIHTRCIVIYPNPQYPNPEIKDEWLDLVDQRSEMKKKMTNVLLRSGFTALKKSGFYAKNCMI